VIDVDDKCLKSANVNHNVDQTAEPVGGTKRLRGLGLGYVIIKKAPQANMVRE
jgi:hypothetical protein